MSKQTGSPLMGKAPRRSVEQWLYNSLGQYDGYYTHPPLNKRKLYLKDEWQIQYVVCLNNDGCETWIGSMDHWYWHTRNKHFRKICFWHLKLWAFADWFGLRSWLWYKLLHRQVARVQKHEIK